MKEPRYIKRIYEKQGRAWTAEETEIVFKWFGEPSQRMCVRWALMRHLRCGLATEEAEDAFAHFYGRVFKFARLRYDPNRGANFTTFALEICFKSACFRLANERTRRINTVPLIECPPADHMSDTSAIVEDRLLIEEIKRYLTEKVKNDSHRLAFELAHFEDMPRVQIAATMNVPAGTVRAWLNRATHGLTVHLQKSEWLAGNQPQSSLPAQEKQHYHNPSVNSHTPWWKQFGELSSLTSLCMPMAAMASSSTSSSVRFPVYDQNGTVSKLSGNILRRDHEYYLQISLTEEAEASVNKHRVEVVILDDATGSCTIQREISIGRVVLLGTNLEFRTHRVIARLYRDNPNAGPALR